MTIETNALGRDPMFSGLSAFPLTPLRDDRVDEPAFVRLMERLVDAGVDSITPLGSTGCAAYLNDAERTRVAQLAVEHAGTTPVFIGVSALRTSHVLRHVRVAEDVGAHGVLLAPVSYQQLTDDDVFGLYATVSEHSELPIIVYDNPGTTHFNFTLELYRRIAALPTVASIKIPGVPADPDAARQHLADIRAVVPPTLSIGVSGDAHGVAGLIAGCDAWYTAVGGTIPDPMLRITRAVEHGDHELAASIAAHLEPLWTLIAAHGSLRVSAAIAEHLNLAPARSLPQPIRGLDTEARDRVAQVLRERNLDQ